MDIGYFKRPTQLYFEHVKHQPQCNEAYNFIRDTASVWNSLSKLDIAEEGLLQDLFHQLNLNPTKEQINDMLRNAKIYSSGIKQRTGLSFGEFSVLAADFRKFSSRASQNGHHPFQITSLSPKSFLRIKKQIFADQQFVAALKIPGSSKESTVEAPEVFLGGSCNPTTWRADVAMPELEKLGISYYNPQVSEWTPDLLELEHRAKEKARAYFFVIDSETRASAGAIEVAHIVGQRQKPLILVLHPYKRNQKILNEPISEEEFLDLSRNQKLLKQLVTRIGLPVLDNILLGLQKIKNILTGKDPCDLPQFSVGSRLISVRRSFDRVKSDDNGLSIKQCSQQLLSLGYRKDLVSSDNLKRILSLIRNVLNNHHKISPISSTESSSETNLDSSFVNFEEFCVISSYLSVLQQEIEDNCCVSPIKGTNLPPPPIFLTNTPEIINQYSKQCSQTEEIVSICQQQHHASNSFSIESSSVSSEEHTILRSLSNGARNDSSRDSGTSSPQPNENSRLLNGSSGTSLNARMSTNVRQNDTIGSNIKQNDYEENDVDSDSNDSVFSTSSEDSIHEVRDIYLGGSCMLRTKWRRDIAIPYLKSKNISFYLPTLHENLTLRDARKVKRHLNLNAAPSLEEIDNTKEDESLMFNPKILDSSRVLLFAITNETRSLAPMTLAAHYIGLGYNVVLCIQMLSKECVIGNDKLTLSAVKDYNRGRTYLKDLALRHNIPVTTEIKDALNCAIQKLNSSKPQCSN